MPAMARMCHCSASGRPVVSLWKGGGAMTTMADGEQPGTGGGRTSPTEPAAPAVELPKGGGAIRGIGEKFGVDPASGTGSLVVPIRTSPGRSGFGPDLSLGYDSGSGNGPFGLGWTLSLPDITRRTERGLPQYDDEHDSDSFVLSGAEELVPMLTREPDGSWQRERLPLRTVAGATYRIDRYRPRIETLFARIERWTDTTDPAQTFWRSISRDDVTTWYGRSTESRIADPVDPSKVFTWLVCESHDAYGNAMVYRYRAEDSAGLTSEPGAHERNRTSASRGVQRYLSSVRYSNRVPFLPALVPDQPWPAPPGTPDATESGALGDASDDWQFEVVFDYGDHDADAPVPDSQWRVRTDAFSTYRPTFELRTYRLCRRVLMFHHFPDQPEIGRDHLVGSTELTHSDDGYALLTSVTQRSYRRRGDDVVSAALPPVELHYTGRTPSDHVHEVASEDLGHLVTGVNSTRTQWVDLHGDGVAGVLTQETGAWHYRRNLSQLSAPGPDGRPRAALLLAPARPVDAAPLADSTSPTGPRTAVVDLGGDGVGDVVMWDGPFPGVFEHDDAEGWAPYRPFPARLTRTLDDPDTRMVDLDGDGRPDLLVTGDDILLWHASRGLEGFGAERRTTLSRDEETGPRVRFAEESQSVFLADLSGDGLTDLCRIRNGEICYWPNLGYGRFGAKVTMDNAPWFDHPDRYDPSRLRLADVDGSGTTDVVYLHPDGVRLYLNESGNGWSPPHTVAGPASSDPGTETDVLDLLGDGTACLVWISTQVDARAPLRYVPLMGEGKPHLLTRVVNNLGSVTRVDYAPSTRFAQEDRLAGRPWSTKLPFPVHVVHRVTTEDLVGRTRLTARYAYHHGHYDGDEREFRGFGMVEQWSTDTFDARPEDPEVPGDPAAPASNEAPELLVPPVYTRTWFHTGSLAGPDDEALLAEPPLPAGLTTAEHREAIRALKGTTRRQEVYAEDGVGRSVEHPHGLPYSVTAQTSRVALVQAAGPNRHAVFLVSPRESLGLQHERRTDDPRRQHGIVLEVDEFGNVLERVTVGYGRLRPDAALPTDADRRRQTDSIVVHERTHWTNPVVDPVADHHRTPLPCETLIHEVIGLVPDEAALLSPDEVPIRLAAAEQRLIEHAVTRYRADDLTELLDPGVLQPLALGGATYRLALTPELVSELYGDRVTEALLAEAGYVMLPDRTGWWAPGLTVHLSPDPADGPAAELAEARAHFYLPRRYRDQFDNDQVTDYVEDLLVGRTRDAVGNEVVVDEHDFRVLQPRVVRDPNGNLASVEFDTLGLVTATAVAGDSLAGLEPDVTDADRDALLERPRVTTADGGSEAAPIAHDLLGGATTRLVYDCERFRRFGEPVAAVTIARETHVGDVTEGQQSRLHVSVSYADGLGRVVQHKAPAPPGGVPSASDPDAVVAPRWVGSGWTVLDQAGRPVRRFEPFFSVDHRYEHDARHGVSPVLLHDPLGRTVATLHPDHTFEKVVLEAWTRTTYDRNDTVSADPRTDPDVGGLAAGWAATLGADWQTWSAERLAGPDPDQRLAAERAADHADTPTRTHLDALGRPFLSVATTRRPADGLGTNTLVVSRVDVDIQGNELAVTDPLGRVVMECTYDTLGRRLRQSSMEAGERTIFPDVTGELLRAWDSRGHETTITRDVLRRATVTTVRGTTADSDPRTLDRAVVVERVEYGETVPDADRLNLRTQVFRHWDTAGLLVHARLSAAGDPEAAFDAKGNQLHLSRRLARDVDGVLDWSLDQELEPETFLTSTRYDALDRPVQVLAPHASPQRVDVLQPTYDEGGLLARVDAWLAVAAPADSAALLDPNTAPPAPVGVSRLHHDAQGRRVAAEYPNGVATTWTYDPLSARLTGLASRRGAEALQELRYTHDPVGNLVRVRDDAQQATFFRGQVVEAGASYTTTRSTAWSRRPAASTSVKLVPPLPTPAPPRRCRWTTPATEAPWAPTSSASTTTQSATSGPCSIVGPVLRSPAGPATTATPRPVSSTWPRPATGSPRPRSTAAVTPTTHTAT